MRHLLRAATLALCIFPLNPQDTYACSCAPPPGEIDHHAWLKQFDGAVFEGTLLRQEQVEKDAEPQLKLTFRVERHWKGVRSLEVVVYTPTDTAMCGIGAERNRSRLIIASRTPTGLETWICHYTYIRDRDAFRAAVGEGSPPPTR